MTKMTTTNPSTYTAPAKLFHWLTVVLLTLQYTLGWLMPDADQFSQPSGPTAWHLSFGALMLLLVLVRLLWRTMHPVPQPLAQSRSLQQAAQVTHWLLYFLLLALPLLGWANASSRGWTVLLFGVLPLPPLLALDSPLGHIFGDLHILAAWMLIVVAGLHVAAALYHHLVAKDDTLQRMLPLRWFGRKAGGSSSRTS